ncbi:MAG: hypothetical protein ACKVPX_12165 [Myxococcaceae bacterium]
MLRRVERYRVELILFGLAFFVFASFSGPRFSRQSAAPHFVYQAKAWLEGRLDIDARVLPNREDWACVRRIDGRLSRCEGAAQAGDRWYVSFPPFPAVVMLPFVALHGYQFNDTSLGVLVGALAIVLAYRFFQKLSHLRENTNVAVDNAVLACALAFASLFFYCTIRGEVWFFAEVLGVALTWLYATSALGAQQPLRAGLFFGIAVLTRTPLLFTAVFFVMEAWRAPVGRARRLGWFCLGALPSALMGAAFNWVRFGKFGEFGHAFLYSNRVNADIDRFGLFDLAYLGRNLEAAFFKLPRLSLEPLRLDYDPHGLSLFLTMPWLLLLLWPRQKSRLRLPLALTVLACALPGLLYQNTGYMQFGFRFSLDYTPYLLALLAVSGWSLRRPLVIAVLALSVLANTWGAVAFRGYTEIVRRL